MINNNNIQNKMQVENIEQNKSQGSMNEVIAPFKEIKYEAFLAIKNKNKKCCCCCYIYKLYQKLDDYENQNIDAENAFNMLTKCCYKNIFIFNILYLIPDFLFSIPTLWLCFYLKPEFKKLKDKKKDFRFLEYYSSDEYNDYWFDTEGIDFEFANIQPKFSLWYNLSILEIIFLFFKIIFEISFLIFLFLLKCKYNEIITETEKKNGRITKKVILVNFIFFVLNLIMIFLSMYFFIFNVFVLFSKTFEDNTIFIVKTFAIAFKGILSFMQYYALKNNICFYMDLNYEERQRNKGPRDNINENDKIKKGYLFINNSNFEVDVKANKNLYLEENNQSKNGHENIVYEFKQIKSNNILDEFIYIRIKNDAYQNMLSITDWRYGRDAKPEQIYKKLDKLLLNIGLLIILLTPPLFFHAKDEEFYNVFRKIIKNNIYKIYGDFELAFSLIRYIIYIIIFVALLSLMFKRIFYGGYMIYKLLKYSNIICHFVNIYNLMIIIFNIILIIFSVKCNSIQSDFIKKNNKTGNYTNVFYFQHYYSYYCLVSIIVIIYKINGFRKVLIKLKNDLDHLYETQNEETEIEFQFAGLDCNNYILKEFMVSGHPRYLYYNLFSFNNDNNTGININNINNDINTNNNINNDINTNNNINNNNKEILKNKVEINYEQLDSKNILNKEENMTNYE